MHDMKIMPWHNQGQSRSDVSGEILDEWVIRGGYRNVIIKTIR